MTDKLETLVKLLRAFGVSVRVHPQHSTMPQEVSADEMDLMWSDKDEPLVIYVQTTTFRAPAADSSDEYDELHMERVIIESYHVPLTCKKQRPRPALGTNDEEDN